MTMIVSRGMKVWAAVRSRNCRYYSDKRISDLLGGVAGTEEKVPETLDDMSTFGSILNPGRSEDPDLKQELMDLAKDVRASTSSFNNRFHQVQDRDLFNKIFEVLEMKNDGPKKFKTSGFMGADINRMDNVNLSLLGTHTFHRQQQNNISSTYKESQEKKIKVINALKPTFAKLAAIQSSKEFLEYVQKEIIHRFEQSLEKDEIKSHADLLKELEMDSRPSSTVKLNKVTMPVLLEYCIRTLARDFESPNEAISLFHSLKESPQLFLHTCTVDLYNTVLQITWDTNKNVEDIKIVLKDMLLNGFLGDMKTTKILSTIKLEVMQNVVNNDKDLFINKFEKYRYHYLTGIENRLKVLAKSQ